MKLYKNLGGNSSIVAYDYDTAAIYVQFKGGAVYKYPAEKVGGENFQKMKQLADTGQGLCSFINRNEQVRSGYAR